MRFLITALLGFSSLVSLNVKAEEILVSLADVRPTQMEVGLAHVEYSREKIEKKAVGSNLLDAAASRVLPGWIGPDGKIYITDGHHWASGTQRVSEVHPEVASRLKLKVNIEADYRGKSWESFFDALHKSGKGYFVPKVRERFEGKGLAKLVEMYRDFLPKNLKGLQNNAGRSLFGMALEEIGIDPNFDLIDYIEFYLNEKFGARVEKKLGIKIAELKKPESITLELVKKVQLELVSDPEMLQFLMNNTRPGVDVAGARANLTKAIDGFRGAEKMEPLASAMPRLNIDEECLKKFSLPQK